MDIDVEITEYIGVAISKTLPSLAAKVIARTCGYPYLVSMPCGQSVAYMKQEDFPRDTVRCPCGDARHWMVKYVDELPC